MLFPQRLMIAAPSQKRRREEEGRERRSDDIAPKERFFSRDYSGAEREIAE